MSQRVLRPDQTMPIEIRVTVRNPYQLYPSHTNETTYIQHVTQIFYDNENPNLVAEQIEVPQLAASALSISSRSSIITLVDVQLDLTLSLTRPIPHHTIEFTPTNYLSNALAQNIRHPTSYIPTYRFTYPLTVGSMFRDPGILGAGILAKITGYHGNYVRVELKTEAGQTISCLLHPQYLKLLWRQRLVHYVVQKATSYRIFFINLDTIPVYE